MFVAAAALGAPSYAVEDPRATPSTHAPHTTVSVRICAGRPKLGTCGPGTRRAKPGPWEDAGTVSASIAEIACPASRTGRCTARVAAGATIVFRATPNTGSDYEFARWADACAHARKQKTCRLLIDARPPHRVVVTAVFRLVY